MKKTLAILLAIVMMFSTVAMAQTEATGEGGAATITIANAANGETYTIAKLFNATVDTTNNSIAYTGDIPAALSAYFTKDTAGNISATAALVLSNEDVQKDLTDWAKTNPTKEAVSDGSALTFSELTYGYYVVVSSQGALITVDSTNPHANITDKNTSAPVPPEGTDVKSSDADNGDVNIGDTVTYTVKFDTANYDGEAQILTYVIHDTLPAFLTEVNVTSIKVGGTAITTQQFENGEITIDWTDGQGKSLYANGAELEITYTAKVGDGAAIDGNGNTNTVEITYTTDDPDKTPDKVTDTDTIFTYAIAIKKVNDKGVALAGATFLLPFYVKSTAADDGAYIYAGTTAGDGLINTLTTPENGVIIVKGVEAGDYAITETAAPAGYNKLTAPVDVTAVKTGSTTTNVTKYLDENGNVVDTETSINVKVESTEIAATPVIVVNKTGSELPSTGGMGTTLFYVVGSLMMAAALVVLVAKKKVAAK